MIKKSIFEVMTDRLLTKAVPVPPGARFDINKYWEAGVIPNNKLIPHRWYFGLCRNACGDIAYWTGKEFYYIREKFRALFSERINTLETDDGHDLFLPFYEVYKPNLVLDIVDALESLLSLGNSEQFGNWEEWEEVKTARERLKEFKEEYERSKGGE